MKEIIVFADWVNLPEIMKMGVLRSEISKGEENEAVDFINQTKKVVSTWKNRAKQLNIANSEIMMMETAFEK